MHAIARIVGLFLATALATKAAAQSIQLTAPLNGVTVPEGADFAADELLNAWDFNERRDIGYEENFVGPTVGTTGGIWYGTNARTGGYVFPLFGGFKGSLLAEGLPGDRELPRFGVNHPIDTGRYTMLALRSRTSAPSSFAIYWSSDQSQSYFPDGRQFRVNLDGVYLERAYPSSGWGIQTFDLRNGWFEGGAGSWSGSVHALRLDRSTAAPAGATTELDWIRLVDPTSAPVIPITWNASGLPPVALITVNIDTDGSGYDGAPLARYVRGQANAPLPGGALYSTSPVPPQTTGRHDLATAILPPGRYYLYLTIGVPNGVTIQEVARSGYSAPITVTSAPHAYIECPSARTGADYATSEVGNPWDMNDAADVANLPGSGVPYQWIQYSNPSFNGSIFQAVADPPLRSIGNQQSDAQVHLNVAPSAPIRSGRYRYLTYRIGIDGSQYPTIHDRVANGLIARPVFWTNDILVDGASTRAHIVYEGMQTYTIDLWQPGLIERGVAWNALPGISHLRLDPLETELPTWFYIDDVKLTAQSSPIGDSFPLSFVIEDSDTPQVQITLFADRDHSGCDGLQIAGMTAFGQGRHVVNWSTAGLADGNYYPCIRLFDGTRESFQYATAPVVIGAGEPPGGLSSGRTPYDYDGDRTSDAPVYRDGRRGKFYVRNSTGSASVLAFGTRGLAPLEGDFDGDMRADVAGLLLKNNLYRWQIRASSTGVATETTWGISGDVPVVGDYDGDLRSDIAVYRAGAWYIRYSSGAADTRWWGQVGDIPVPADFDGDRRTDLAIWRPSDGTWWILYSGFTSGRHSTYSRSEQWGLKGDLPFAVDLSNDGRADLLVYRPSTGSWYTREVGTSAFGVNAWGLAGDIPVLGDFTGDGAIDLTVWRPRSGTWYINDRRGSFHALQWGIQGDRIPE